MNTATKKKVTLMIDAQVYESLKQKVGARGIGAYVSDLVRPHVVENDLEAGYKAMAIDTEREKEAKEWTEATLFIPDETDEVWEF